MVRDRGEQSEGAERVGDGPGGVSRVLDRALETDESEQHVLEPVGDAGVAEDAPRVDADDDQAQAERTGSEQDEVGQRPPAAAWIGQGGELAPMAHQQHQEHQRDQRADDRVAVDELCHGTCGQ